MEISKLKEKAAQHHYYLSPNVYLERQGKRYDTSLWITPDGQLADTAQMVHIAQAKQKTTTPLPIQDLRYLTRPSEK